MSILDKVILGISDTHDASAALIRGGKIIAAVSEERIQRIKSIGGYPAGAVESCLRFAGLSKSDIDYVAVAGTRAVPVNLLGTLSTFSSADFLRIQEEIRWPFFYEGRHVPFASVFPDYHPKGNVGYPLGEMPLKETRELNAEERHRVSELRLDCISKWTGVPRERVFTLDHHTCHAYYGYYASTFRGHPTTVLTMDNGGDGVYDSVNRVTADGSLERIHASHECIVAAIYSFVTMLLGMRPFEHEYKVMGLAPYAKEHTKRRVRELLIDYMRLDGIRFSRNPALKDLFFHTRDILKLERFDGIAGGVQDFAEHYVTRWVEAAIKVTGARRVTFTGGVALNVKANMLVSQLPQVDRLFVPPGAGDESLSIGAVWALMDQLNRSGNHRDAIEPLQNAYLGPEFSAADSRAFAEHPAVRARYTEVEGNADDLIADALSRHEVLAICRGRMEFGPRSLGHRSIIANPATTDTIKRINEAVKGRDFWMPFAPSIVDDDAQRYLVSNDRVDRSYMTCCAETTAQGRSALAAALHPYDQTARPQIVTQEAAPDYHRLLCAVRKRLGVGAVLNTSLNIHGKPIVMYPIDIANELLADPNVYIDGVVVGDRFFAKRA